MSESSKRKLFSITDQILTKNPAQCGHGGTRSHYRASRSHTSNPLTTSTFQLQENRNEPHDQRPQQGNRHDRRRGGANANTSAPYQTNVSDAVFNVISHGGRSRLMATPARATTHPCPHSRSRLPVVDLEQRLARHFSVKRNAVRSKVGASTAPSSCVDITRTNPAKPHRRRHGKPQPLREHRHQLVFAGRQLPGVLIAHSSRRCTSARNPQSALHQRAEFLVHTLCPAPEEAAREQARK